MSYKVLLLGSGGREHALALKIAQSPELSEFYALPGNPGISKVARCIKGSVNDFELVKSIVKEKTIDMVVVGPEDPLVNGLRDYLLQDESLENLLFIGPGKDGAALEGSKDFAKAFMMRHNIPTAKYRTFSGEIQYSHRTLPYFHLRSGRLCKRVSQESQTSLCTQGGWSGGR